jgi:hypothetical protein
MSHAALREALSAAADPEKEQPEVCRCCGKAL